MKIAFVCHGNICRSPMAEFILKDMLAKENMTGVEVSSFATSSEEIWGGVGNPVYPPAREQLKKHGIFCDGKRAVKLTKADYSAYDFFIVMDENNLRNAKLIFGGDSQNKISKLMDYTARGGNVADPWYSGNFEVCYRDIEEGCRGVMEQIILK